MQHDDLITCIGKDAVTRYFYVFIDSESERKTHFSVSRHPNTSARHPAYDGDEAFQASFVKHDEQTIRVSEIYANAPYYRGKGIPHAILSFVTRHTEKGIVSSQTSGQGAERRSDEATEMWERLEESGNAMYLPDSDRYQFVDNVLPSYVLDTSIIRGISGDRLKKAAEHARLFVSPLSVLEMLCHLEEPPEAGDDAETTYLRRRGYTLKCSFLNILPSPIADFATRIGHPDKIKETWHETAPLCARLLKKLDQHDNPSDFYDSVLVDSDGHRRPMLEVAKRCRAVLEDAESDYVECVRQWVTSLDDNRPGWSDFETDNFVGVVADNCRDVCDEFGISKSEDLARCGASLYPYFGYMLSRAQKCGVSLDVNDTEDSLLCLHLGLDIPRTLVANDNGSVEAIQNALAQYQATGEGGLARTRVLSRDGFIKEIDELTSETPVDR